jgi:hypothetical protein
MTQRIARTPDSRQDAPMRTVCGWGRLAQTLTGRGKDRVVAVAAVRPLAGGRAPLITDRLGLQSRSGVKLDQVDGTTCGSAVLVALAAWADPAETQRLDGVVAAVGASAGVTGGFGTRYDERQRQVHGESTRFWPQALGTSPWGMVAWLRRHAPGAGPYRVRLVDDTSASDVSAVIDTVDAALAAGRPVPLLIGTFVPRHYCLALARDGADAWRVYEPTSGEVRSVALDLVRRRAFAPLLGFDRLHAVLLPA